MKKLLIIAYYFLPSQTSGVFRTLAFTRYLASTGWDITLLTVKPEEAWDEQKVTGDLPKNVTLVRARERDFFFLWNVLKRSSANSISSELVSGHQDASSLKQDNKPNCLHTIKEQVTGLLKVPDSQTGWFFPALRKGRGLARPDIIYSSGPPFTCHLVGACLKRKWKVPLVIDYRDPWWGNPFRYSRDGIVEKWDQYLEKRVIDASDHVILNTRPMEKMYVRHFPEARDKISVITNGFAPEEFKGIAPERRCGADTMLFVHPGVLYGQRNPLPFLRAVGRAVHNKNIPNIFIQFIGRYEQFEGKKLQQHIEELHLTNHVALYPPVEHTKVLSFMKGADMLLLLALGTTLQVPAKLFEYLGIGKPIFAVCEPESATLQIMNKLGIGHYCMTNNQEEILHSLESAYSAWQLGGLADDLQDKQTVDFERSALSCRLDTILREILVRSTR